MASELRDELQRSLGATCIIERELGGGGMSRVFVATETALGRQIVVKVLPAEGGATLSAERFKREIQVAARLQHPHIVPLLAAGEMHGLPFYTMPFVNGESLRSRLSRSGELSLNETRHILRDIASALAYAHAEGIVHRDIKPENVMLSGGVAVVTDFGVAKAMDASLTDGGTIRGGLTSLGVALGTPAYMAPEQASADPHVDHRADIYAFGCLAYEMLAGSSPFAGRPPQQLLAAHVTETPESLLTRRPTLPPPIAALVMRCLEKRAGDRPQSADELIAALDAISTPSGEAAPTGARVAAARAQRTTLYAGVVGVLMVGVLAIALWVRTTAFTPYRVSATLPIAVTSALEMEPAISPDGKMVAYAAATPTGFRIFVRQVAGGRPVLLTQDLDGDHRWPRWSPDQSSIVFAAKGAAYTVPALGGSPKRAFDSPNGDVLTPSWSPDGKEFAYSDSKGIWVRPVRGEAASSVLLVRGYQLHSPSWSPRGDLLAYVEGRPLALDNISTDRIWIVARSGGGARRVSDSIHTNASPVFAPDGQSLLYLSNVGGSLDIYQQPVRTNGSAAGEALRITTSLNAFTISISANGGRIAYDVVQNGTSIWMARIGPGAVATTAAAQRVTHEKERIEHVSLSHDGKWLAYDSNRGGTFNIYKLRLEGGDPIQVTSDPVNDYNPAWSPDDRTIVFHSTRGPSRNIFTVSAEGNGVTAVTSGSQDKYSPAYSPDGRSISFTHVFADSARLEVVTRGADGGWSAPRGIAEIELTSRQVTMRPWSPDGRLIAFVSGGALRVVSTGGGAPAAIIDSAAIGRVPSFAMWSGDGSMLYVTTEEAAKSTVWLVPLQGGKPRAVLVDDPARRLALPFIGGDDHRLYFMLGAGESDVWVMDLQR